MSETPRRIRVIVADDEPLARASLTLLIGKDPELELVAEAASGPETVAAIRNLQPDVVFLDVEMPGCDGFEVLQQLDTATLPTVIFVTAYGHYAVKAFEAEALDYLLKPFTNERFQRVVQRAVQRVNDRLVEEPQRQTRLMIKNNGRLVIVQDNEIDWIEAADYYACVHTNGRELLLRRTLSDLESQLDARLFCRVHRSAIVNIERVREVAIDRNGDYEILLHNGEHVRLSRNYRDAFQEKLATHASPIR
jgi:two-component system LytT family response regulator